MAIERSEQASRLLREGEDGWGRAFLPPFGIFIIRGAKRVALHER